MERVRSKSNQREGCSKSPQFRSVRSKKGDLMGYSSFLDQQLEESNYECIQVSCRQTYYLTMNSRILLFFLIVHVFMSICMQLCGGYITDLSISTLTIHYQAWLDTPDYISISTLKLAVYNPTIQFWSLFLLPLLVGFNLA